MTKFLALFGAVAALACAAVPKKTGPIPAAVLFRDYDHNRMILSPDGRTLASVFPQEESKNNYRAVLASYDIEKRQPTVLLGKRGVAIGGVWWVGDSRLLVRYWTAAGPGLMACNSDGSQTVILQSPVETAPLGGVSSYGEKAKLLRHVTVVHALPDDPAQVLVARGSYDQRAEKWLDREFREMDTAPGVYRLNTFTGEFTTEVKDPEMAIEWIADPAGRVRVAVSLVRGEYDEKLKQKDRTRFPSRRIYWINDDGSADLVPEVRANWEDEFIPLAAEAGGRSFLFVSRQGRDRAAVWRYSHETKSITGPVAESERVDVAQAVSSLLDSSPAYVSLPDGRDHIHYLDDNLKLLQPGLDEALGEFVNRFSSWDRKRERMLIYSTSPREPGRYYLFDRKAETLEAVFYRAAWLNEWTLATTEPVSFTARDGVRLDGYLTRPPGADPGQPRPTFLLVHGGPWTIRDYWEFNPEVQFLASRGYAVLQVNFRGSGGYGAAFAQLAQGEFGGKMQDDLTDAAQWALRNGIAERGRLGIAGASYGGYAVLRALTRDPELFQVGLAFFAVSDVARQIKHYQEREAFQLAHAFWQERVGDPAKDAAKLEEISPINQVARIQAPLFIVYGEKDPLISFGQSADFVRSLRKHRKTFVRHAPAKEGHGIGDEEARIKVYEALDEFLHKHFPAR